MYYIGITFVAVTYCYFGILLISIVHNTPFLYLPNLILFIPICIINVAILVFYTKRQSDQFIHTSEALCKVFQCHSRTFYWIYIDILAVIVPYLLLLPFFVILIKVYKYFAYKSYYKSKFKKDTIADDIKSQELGSPSLPGSVHNSFNHSQVSHHSHHSLSHPSHVLQPPSPHVPPTGLKYDSPHNAPLAEDPLISLDNIEHIISNSEDEKSPKLSDNGPTSTLLNAGHIVIDRKERAENRYELPNTIRTTLKPNRISCCYCLRSIFSIKKLYWLFIPPCQDQLNTLKLYSYTLIYVIGILSLFTTQYFIAQINQDNIQNYFIQIYLIVRCIIFPQKQIMKHIARKIDALRLNFVDEENVFGYSAIGSAEEDQVESIPFRDQISFEYFTEYFLVYLYYDTYRYLFVAQNIDPFLFMGTMIIHFGFNILDNIFRSSHWYWSCTFDYQRDHLDDNKCLICVRRDLSEEKEWRLRITADINVQFIACCVNTIFWILVIPSQLDYWKDVYNIDVKKAYIYISISFGVDLVAFLIYFIWYMFKHKANIFKPFIAIYIRHQWKLVCCIAIVSGTLSQKWYFLLENFKALSDY
eukprot:479207_1